MKGIDIGIWGGGHRRACQRENRENPNCRNDHSEGNDVHN